jgi:hypothetical protein
MKSKNIKTASIALAAVALIAVLLALLIPIDKHNKELDKYGDLAEAAETDERARYIIDNIDLYPNEMVDSYNSAKDDKKEQTLDFVYNYPFHKDDYSNMEFTEEELNAETVPALYMADFRWGYEKISGSYIKSQGCAAVALTMAYLYLRHDSDVDPKKIADYAEENDCIMPVIGGINSLDMDKVAEGIGLSCKVYNYDKDEGGSGEADIETIQSILNEGHVVMAGMVGETFGGHAIIIRECSDDGTLYINDPASPEKTEKEWNIADIGSEIYYIWDLS